MGEGVKQVHSAEDVYVNLISVFRSPESMHFSNGESRTETKRMTAELLPDIGLDEIELRMMYWDSIAYLPDDILCRGRSGGNGYKS